MKLYSTLHKGVVNIESHVPDVISMYNCGPTVYDKAHVGHLRAYVNWDVLHRALVYLGYDVKRVMNFTDVGHMSEDQDFGDDKMEGRAKLRGLSPIEVANESIREILKDFSRMNILAPNGKDIDFKMDLSSLKEYGWLRATDYVGQMIELVKEIESNGYAYETEQAVYFDVSKLKDYNIFTGQALEDKEEGVRDEVNVDKDKRNPADFVLWMKRAGKYANHAMYWDSPWGVGFPGWHIECSAMGYKALGEYFDIHTGGIDHVSVHHTNERAQNIGAFGHDLVKYWVHNEWLVGKDGEKMSKSLGGMSLDEVIAWGYEPMDLRFLFVSINYRVRMSFSKEAMDGARNSRSALVERVKLLGEKEGVILEDYKERFKECLEDSLNMSKALALTNELLKSENDKGDILATVLDFDKVFGLDIADSIKSGEVPQEVIDLANRRKDVRDNKDFDKADDIRDEITKLGFKVLDVDDGFKIERI